MRRHVCTGSDGRVVEFGRTIRVDSSSARIDVYRSPEKYRAAFAAAFPDYAVNGGTAVAPMTKSGVGSLMEEGFHTAESPGVFAGGSFAEWESIAEDFGWSLILSNLPGVISDVGPGVVTVATSAGSVKFIADTSQSSIFPLSMTRSVVTADGQRHDISSSFLSLLWKDCWYEPYWSKRDDIEERPTKSEKDVPDIVIDTRESRDVIL